MILKPFIEIISLSIELIRNLQPNLTVFFCRICQFTIRYVFLYNKYTAGNFHEIPLVNPLPERNNNMNNDFPRILSLLRSEKQLSQKQAAEDLGIAQALLSHYEKGKRECGLDFLVKAADYYNVSTDYLLGRSPVSTGALLTENDIPEGAPTGKADGFSFSSSLAKKLIISSVDVIYSLLNKTKNKKLAQSISTILSLNIYKSFRLIYKLNPKNDKNLFVINEESAFRAAAAGELLAESAALAAINDSSANSPENIEITTATLESEYNKQAAALLNLIRNSENTIKKYE